MSKHEAFGIAAALALGGLIVLQAAISWLTLEGRLSSRAALPTVISSALGALVILALIARAIRARSRDEQQLLDAFLEHIPDHVYFKDRRSRFVRVSRSLAKYFGLTDPSQAIDKTDADIFSAEHATGALADEQAIIRSGQGIVGKEEKETWTDGRETWVLTTKVPLRDRHGRTIGTMGISHDITARKHAEHELEEYKRHLEELVEARSGELVRANAQLQQDIAARQRAEEELARKAQELARSNADLEDFAYAASHDLQEPLRMVASYTQLLARRYKGRLDADADDFIAFAVDGATRMQHLIQDLLAYSRVTRKALELVPIDATSACDQAVLNLGTAIAESGTTVTVEPLPLVVADPTQLTRLLQNLIGNGIKYRGARAPEIHVAARADGNDWLFSVRDNGIGIEPRYFDRIFQMFQRLHPRSQYSGTGIGLAICRKIVEFHGGRIWVESEPGHGSTFWFTLPRAERKAA